MNLSDLRTWRPETLIEVADALTDLRSAVQTVGDTARDRVLDADGFGGRAATAAETAVSGAHRDLTRVGVGVLSCVDTLHAAAATLTPARDAAVALIDEALSAGYTVTDVGEVTAPPVSVGNPVLDLVFTERLRTRAAALQWRLAAAVQAAVDADTQAADRLRDAGLRLDATPVRESVAAVLDGRVLLPAEPTALAAFWSNLSPAEKDALAAWDPAIGGRDGLPAGDRDHYNRRHLDQLAAATARDLAVLDSRHPDWAQGQHIPPDQSSRDMRVPTETEASERRAYDDWARERDALRTTAAGYAALGSEISSPERYLLCIDAHGRAAVATGNPDHATHVATFVPGTGTRLGTIGTDIARAQRMSDAAEQSAASVAVITWLGYDAPPTILHAATDGYADDGAVRLRSFQEGLAVAHLGPPAHTTVVGHSYGTLVIGAAASTSLAADDVVLVASPGIDLDHVQDLRLNGVDRADIGRHVYATAAPTDPVPYVGDVFGPVLHGVNPVRDGFGATVFDSGPVVPASVGGVAVSPVNPFAHSGYWDSGSIALTNLGRIIAGLTPSSAPPD